MMRCARRGAMVSKASRNRQTRGESLSFSMTLASCCTRFHCCGSFIFDRSYVLMATFWPVSLCQAMRTVPKDPTPMTLPKL